MYIFLQFVARFNEVNIYTDMHKSGKGATSATFPSQSSSFLQKLQLFLKGAVRSYPIIPGSIGADPGSELAPEEERPLEIS